MATKMSKIIWFFKNAADWMASILIGNLPHAPGANGLKTIAMRLRGAQIGKGVKIWSGVWFDSFDHLKIGDHVTIGRNALFIASGGISIGDRCMIGHGSYIISVGHNIPPDKEPMRFTGPDSAPIHIEKDSWLGAAVVILPGVTVNEGAVVGAGSVVTKDVESFTIAGGSPAQIIRKRIR